MQHSFIPHADAAGIDPLDAVPFDLLRAMIAQQQRETPTVRALHRGMNAQAAQPAHGLLLGRERLTGSFFAMSGARPPLRETGVNQAASNEVEGAGGTSIGNEEASDDDAAKASRFA